MIIKNEINITKQGEEKIKETFIKYAKTNVRPNKIDSWCVLHIYPTEDTITKDGHLNGYEDSLFFKLFIYDCEKKTVYESPRLHDAIRIDKKSEIRYFKDLSMMILLHDGAKFNWNQDVVVY